MFPASDRSARATFRLLSKLDEAFSSLLTGQSTATGEALPGFDHGRRVSTTDKVRLKGIVDRTRLAVARAMSGGSMADDESDDGEPMDTDTEGDTAQRQDTVKFEGFDDDDDDDGGNEGKEADDDYEERNIAGVYERTIGELGDVLGGPPIGIITDDWGLDGTAQQRSGPGYEESEGVIEL
jgi:hypothetical protein